MKKLYSYKIDCWFRKNDEKDFLTTTIIAESDEIAEELAKETSSHIYKVEIKSKEPYVSRD